jgi:small subunit ribosomal protein S20
VANIKQQKKRIGQDAKRRAANAMFKSSMKTAIKRVETEVDSGNQAQAVTELSLAFKKLDKALSKGILHKNNVARQKRYLQSLVNDLAAGKEVVIKNKPKVKARPQVAEEVVEVVEDTEEKEESPEA